MSSLGLLLLKDACCSSTAASAMFRFCLVPPRSGWSKYRRPPPLPRRPLLVCPRPVGHPRPRIDLWTLGWLGLTAGRIGCSICCCCCCGASILEGSNGLCCCCCCCCKRGSGLRLFFKDSSEKLGFSRNTKVSWPIRFSLEFLAVANWSCPLRTFASLYTAHPISESFLQLVLGALLCLHPRDAKDIPALYTLSLWPPDTHDDRPRFVCNHKLIDGFSISCYMRLRICSSTLHTSVTMIKTGKPGNAKTLPFSMTITVVLNPLSIGWTSFNSTEELDSMIIKESTDTWTGADFCAAFLNLIGCRG